MAGLVSKVNLLALRGGGDLKIRGGGNKSSRCSNHAVDEQIIMGRVVMKQVERANLGGEGQGDHARGASVTPPAPAFAFFDGVLGIGDQNVDPLAKLNNLRLISAFRLVVGQKN